MTGSALSTGHASKGVWIFAIFFHRNFSKGREQQGRPLGRLFTRGFKRAMAAKQLRPLLVALFVCWHAVVPCCSAEANTYPLITDEAAVLTPEQHEEISALLLAHNKKGPGRISVFIATKLPPETTIEKFARDKINSPPPTAREKADRILIALALEDRKMRIETSRQVWAALPDSFCRDVITQKMAPQFKDKKYFEGIQAGISALIAKLTQ